MNQSYRSVFFRSHAPVLAGILIVCLLLQFTCTRLFAENFDPQYQPSVSLEVFSSPDCPVVVLDAGHGGYDGGADGLSKIPEKELNLAITKKVAAFLSLFDVRVILTRADDTAPDLFETESRKRGEILSRAKIATDAKADLFLSIHMNTFPDESCRGTQVFYSARNAENAVFSNILQSAVVQLLQPENKRVPKETDLILLLKNLDLPAALIECGFLSNPGEAEQLCDETYQNRLAFSIGCAIISYLEHD